jgi:hypothetical protein
MGDTLVCQPFTSPILTVTSAPAKDGYWAYDPAKDSHADLNTYTSPVEEHNDGLPYPCCYHPSKV